MREWSKCVPWCYQVCVGKCFDVWSKWWVWDSSAIFAGSTLVGLSFVYTASHVRSRAQVKCIFRYNIFVNENMIIPCKMSGLWKCRATRCCCFRFSFAKSAICLSGEFASSVSFNFIHDKWTYTSQSLFHSLSMISLLTFFAKICILFCSCCFALFWQKNV